MHDNNQKDHQLINSSPMAHHLCPQLLLINSMSPGRLGATAAAVAGPKAPKVPRAPRERSGTRARRHMLMLGPRLGISVLDCLGGHLFILNCLHFLVDETSKIGKTMLKNWLND